MNPFLPPHISGSICPRHQRLRHHHGITYPCQLFQPYCPEVLPASRSQQTAGLIADGVPQDQGQDNASLYDNSYASYVSYDMEDTTDAPAEVCPCDQDIINRYLERHVNGMNDKMTSVTAGIQSIQEMLAN